MTREQAIAIAQKCAKAKPQSYYGEPFQPHEWVIDAIMEAIKPLETALRSIGLYGKSNDVDCAAMARDALSLQSSGEGKS